MLTSKKLLAATLLVVGIAPSEFGKAMKTNRPYLAGRTLGPLKKDGEPFKDAAGNTYVRTKGTIRCVARAEKLKRP
jgi:hypothetical protein